MDLAGHSDTSSAAREQYFALLRAQTAAQSAVVWSSLCDSMRVVAIAGIRLQYPDADEAMVRWRLAELLYGEEVAIRLFGPLSNLGSK
jgi:hypothetical protein